MLSSVWINSDLEVFKITQHALQALVTLKVSVECPEVGSEISKEHLSYQNNLWPQL